MSYEVLARKYRPRAFEDVVGQEAVTAVLRGALEQDRVGHAFLFCGPRGVGKTSTARILARALNCVEGPTPSPCGRCDRCEAITEGRELDVVEIDGASHRKIDDVRALREQVGYAPMHGRYKIYIVDEVHQLTSEAFNALLKTLEEPPPHVKFVFATTEIEKVPETIRSRCQIHEFRRIREEDIVRRLEQVCLAEERVVDTPVLAAIARTAGGGMRDSQTLLDQLLALREGPPTLEDVERISGRTGLSLVLQWLEKIQAGDAAGLLRQASDSLERGRREEDMIEDLIEALREMLLIDTLGAETELSTLSPKDRDALNKLGRSVRESTGSADAVGWIDALISILLRARADLRWAGASARLVFELALVRMCRLSGLVTLEELSRRLEMERRSDSNRTASPAPTRRPPAPSREDATPFKDASSPPMKPGKASASTAALPKDVTDLFERFVRMVDRRERALGEICSSKMRPLRWTGSELHVSVTDCDFAELALIGDEQNRKVLQASLQAILGDDARVVFDSSLHEPGEASRVVGDAGPMDDLGSMETTAEAPARSAAAVRDPDPMVTEIKGLFDGDEID